MERLRRDLRFANERAEDATRNKSQEVSGMLSKYNRQLTEVEDSLRVRIQYFSDFGGSESDNTFHRRLSKSKSMTCSNNSTRKAGSSRVSEKRRIKRLRLRKRV